MAMSKVFGIALVALVLYFGSIAVGNAIDQYHRTVDERIAQLQGTETP